MMKRLLYWSVIVGSMCTVGPLYAQDEGCIVKGAVTLDGLQVGSAYTIRQILETFGEHPTLIRYPSVWDEVQDAYTLYFGINRIECAEGAFFGFCIISPAYLVNNHIRVGDPIGKIDALGGKWDRTDANRIQWQTGNPQTDDWLWVVFTHDDSGYITRIEGCVNPF